MSEKNIILDQTGVLPLLVQRVLPEHKTVFCQSRLQCLQLLETNENIAIIVHNERLISESAKKRANLIRFNKSHLPLEFSGEILDQIGQESLLVLFDYTPKGQFVSQANFDTLLKKAYENKYHSELQDILGCFEHTLDKDIISAQTWLTLGAKWGQLQHLLVKLRHNAADYAHLGHGLNKQLLEFYFSDSFKNLYYYQDLKLIHQVPAFIQDQEKPNFALVCFDGMGFSEWLVLKEYLKQKIKGVEVKEHNIFNLVPTTTSICRQALFCGDYSWPYLEDIDEAKAFFNQFKDWNCAFYKDKDLSGFTKNSLVGIEALGVIFNVFDYTAHSLHSLTPEQGKGFYFEQARMYLENSNVAHVLSTLLENRFYLYITSDHGVMPARGKKKIPPKYLQEQFGKRGCLANHPLTDESSQFITCPIPFVSGKSALLAESGELFGHSGETGLTHGGISLDESILPFVEVCK